MDRSLMVLVSGNGTTLRNLCDHIRMNTLNARISCVVANHSNIKAADVATEFRLPYWCLDPKVYPERGNWDTVFQRLVKTYNPGLIILAGFDRLLKIPENYEERILNCHPSLLPDYGGKGMYGIHVHKAVLEAKETRSGCTIHIVDEKYDNGSILRQQHVKVNEHDTPETLMRRVQCAERYLYPKVINSYLTDLISRNEF